VIWVLIGALAAFVVGFFVYFFVIRFKRLERFGSVAVPGDEVVQLPAGDVKVYYEDSRRFRYSETPEPWRGFSVLVSNAESGRRIDLADPPRAATTYKVRGKTRIPFGTLRLPAEGGYRVVSNIDPEALDPRITFG
jgi:hypothetical protein